VTGVWAGPYLAACGLLVVAGAAKAWSPDTTARALHAAGLPGRRALVRLGGAIEALLGAAAVLSGAPALAVLVGLSYVCFSGFIVLALRRGTPISSCGCFGTPDTPPNRLHVVINLAAAAVAAVVATRPASPLTSILSHQPLAGIPLLGLAATAGYLAYLSFVFPFGGSR
jgi:hypothetical protein